ncbi:MAG TPA: NAD-dependent epimerase/dehydratase family protein [Actinomycetota bacterium]|jgi:UDP-glucose 4-epimerase
MRVVVLGGTRFIGRAVVEDLLRARNEVLIVHRGQHEPPELQHVTHLHMDRSELPIRSAELAEFRPDAVIDCNALSREDATSALSGLPQGLRLLVLSSMDVYRAWGSVLEGTETDPVPLTEESPTRVVRFPYRGRGPEFSDYEKLDVEEEYRSFGATVCRLPFVYGERDYQLREEFVLRRVRAGRTEIPVGSATWLWSKGYVGEIARGIRLALESERAGEIFNLCEPRTASMGMWIREILASAGSEARLVHVPEDLLPEDCRLTRTVAQHVVFDPAKARDVLGWVHSDWRECVHRSVRWHLAHPPDQSDRDFAQDDAALAAAIG